MKRHLLVASASGALTERIDQYFSQRGYEVDIAHGGVECLEAIARIVPDALVLDWDLPWGGGAGVLACLRDADTAADLPVILLAGRFSKGVDRSPPVAWCLRRPVDTGLLYDAVDSELDAIAQSTVDASAVEPPLENQTVCR